MYDSRRRLATMTPFTARCHYDWGYGYADNCDCDFGVALMVFRYVSLILQCHRVSVWRGRRVRTPFLLLSRWRLSLFGSSFTHWQFSLAPFSFVIVLWLFWLDLASGSRHVLWIWDLGIFYWALQWAPKFSWKTRLPLCVEAASPTPWLYMNSSYAILQQTGVPAKDKLSVNM
jgi:hypothetical protein